MKKQLPQDFNLYWVKNTSFKYQIIQENNYIYEYIFNFLTFLLFVLFFFNSVDTYYLVDILVTPAEAKAMVKITRFITTIVVGVVFALNFLFAIINANNILKIIRLIKESSGEEKNDLRVLRSYYTMLFFFNTTLCSSIVFFYFKYYLNLIPYILKMMN
jgi:hypothetical protein